MEPALEEPKVRVCYCTTVAKAPATGIRYMGLVSTPDALTVEDQADSFPKGLSSESRAYIELSYRYLNREQKIQTIFEAVAKMN